MRLDTKAILDILQDRWVMWTGIFLAICILARPVINVALMNLMLGWASSHSAHAEMPTTLATPVAKSVHHAKPTRDLNYLPLKSELLPYELHFYGMVNCGGEPFPSELELVVTTGRHDSEVHRFVPVTKDGHFDIRLPIHEELRSGMAWRLTARLATGTIVDARGRQILTTESVVDIEAPLCPR